MLNIISLLLRIPYCKVMNTRNRLHHDKRISFYTSSSGICLQNSSFYSLISARRINLSINRNSLLHNKISLNSISALRYPNGAAACRSGRVYCILKRLGIISYSVTLSAEILNRIAGYYIFICIVIRLVQFKIRSGI